MIQSKFQQIRIFCQLHQDPAIVKKYSRYFREGYDAWGLSQPIMEEQRKTWLKEWGTDFTFNIALELGNVLAAEKKYEEVIFGYWFIYQFRNQFSKSTFLYIGNWLEKYITNWAHTDIIASEMIPFFFLEKICSLDSFVNWIDSPSKWKRRAVPVSLIKLVKAGWPPETLLNVISPMMNDTVREVHQGLGWFIRETWKKHPAATEEFLYTWKNTCARLIIQYATEKMDKAGKERFKKEKNRS